MSLTKFRPIPSCPKTTIILDRYNKPLKCFQGYSIRPDIWIQPDKKCPRFLSHRCTPCKCKRYPLCSSSTRRRVKSWSTDFIPHPTDKGKGWVCCTPIFECVSGNAPDISMPPECKTCVCPFGGNPDNPDPHSIWDHFRVATIPCPSAPFCKPGTVPKALGIGPDGCMRYICVTAPPSIPDWCKTARVDCTRIPGHVCCGGSGEPPLPCGRPGFLPCPS